VTDSGYDDRAQVKQAILRGQHRRLVGGMWEEIGQLQLDFLIARGLRPHDNLLDIGCGALRGGVKLIPWLDPGRYWGIDKNDLLLAAGWDLELKRDGLHARQPREQLVALQDFDFDTLGVSFDCAIAQSLFTHLSLNRIRRCLARLAPCMASGRHLYATCYLLADDHDREIPQHHAGGAVSHSDRSFYHYDMRDFAFVVGDLPWTVEYFGDWGHPRGQTMLTFTRA